MDERESEAWLGLITVSQLLPAALDSQLQRDAHLTHFEFMVLTALRFAPEEHPADDRARRVDERHAPPALRYVCSRLTTRGIVDRAQPRTSATGVRLTAEGRRELIHAMPGHIDTARRLVIVH